jgi:hypothetical protein
MFAVRANSILAFIESDQAQWLTSAFGRGAAGHRSAATKMPYSEAARPVRPVLLDSAGDASGKPWRSLGFSGDINGLGPLCRSPAAPFLLASIARILYPVGCLACERPRP